MPYAASSHDDSRPDPPRTGRNTRRQFLPASADPNCSVAMERASLVRCLGKLNPRLENRHRKAEGSAERGGDVEELASGWVLLPTLDSDDIRRGDPQPSRQLTLTDPSREPRVAHRATHDLGRYV
jgi:hypothetical protein